MRVANRRQSRLTQWQTLTGDPVRASRPKWRNQSVDGATDLAGSRAVLRLGHEGKFEERHLVESEDFAVAARMEAIGSCHFGVAMR